MADARDVLEDTPLFERLDDAAFDALVASTTEVRCAPGELVVREGAPGDALFVILAGSVQVFKARADGTQLVIARLEAGDYFGEQALLPGRPGTRNASVRAVDDVRLCRIDKPSFQAILAADHPLKEHLLDAGDDQLIGNLALESSLFRALELAAPELDPEHAVRAGEVVFREGDPSDALYLVVEGEIEIYRDAPPESLALLGAGTSFGELGILERTDRAASARAVVDSRLVRVPASRFRAWSTSAPALHALFKTLRRVYRLPGRGQVTQSTGTFLGREAVTNLYELPDGRSFVVSLVVGEDLYNSDQIFDRDEPPIRTVVHASAGLRRELQVTDDGTVVGITAHGLWPALGELQRRMLDGVHIEPDTLAAFERTGDVAFARDDAPATGLVCSCLRVDRATLVTAIARGANRLASLQQATGCGTVCGSCVPAMRQLLGNEHWAAIRIADERVHPARDVLALKLRPVDRPVAPCLPGQHVILSGLVDGEWLQRPYTLSSACTEADHYEITVKREPDGQFSSWLFDHAGDDTILRISPPRGDYWWKPTGRPAVFVVAGIGITPALAAIRSALRERWTDRMHVDYSARDPLDIVAADELAAVPPHVSIRTRITSRDGRIHQHDIDDLARRFPGAEYFLCGPDAFMSTVTAMLRRAAISVARIRIERFVSSAAPVARTAPPPEPSLRGLLRALFQRG